MEQEEFDNAEKKVKVISSGSTHRNDIDFSTIHRNEGQYIVSSRPLITLI